VPLTKHEEKNEHGSAEIDDRKGIAMRKDRTIPMSKEMVEIMKEQLDAFREKFGREAGPEDPVFFNPHCDTPMPLTAEYVDRMMTDALERAGIDLHVPLGESVFDTVISQMRRGRTQGEIEAEFRRMRLKERNKRKRIRKGGTK